MRAKYLIAPVLVTATFVSACIMSGGYDLLTFVDLPSLLVVVLMPLGIALASWPLKDIGRSFTALDDPGASAAELRKAALFFASLRSWAFEAAALGLLMGLVLILKHYQGDQNGRLGINLAVMLLCLSSALFLDLAFVLPLSAAARRRLAEEGKGGAEG